MDQNPFEALMDEIDEFDEVENPYQKYCDRWVRLLKVKRVRLRSRTHAENDVVVRDVNRSLWRFSFCKAWTEEMREIRRESLRHVLDACFASIEEGRYYQGFHDVAETCFAVCGFDEELTLGMLIVLARRYFVDATRPDLARVALALRLIVNVVFAADEGLGVELFGVETVAREPVWALSWIITWFSHNLEDFDTLLNLWDTILAVDHAAYPLYLAAALVIRSKERLVDFEDGPSLYSTFAKLPKHVSNKGWIDIARGAKLLLRNHPPTTLWTHSLPTSDLRLMLKPLQLELALAHFYERRTPRFLVFVLYAIWTRRPGAILLLASRHLLKRRRKSTSSKELHRLPSGGIALLGSAATASSDDTRKESSSALTTKSSSSTKFASFFEEDGGPLAALRISKSSASILVACILAALLGSSSDFSSTTRKLVGAIFRA